MKKITIDKMIIGLGLGGLLGFLTGYLYGRAVEHQWTMNWIKVEDGMSNELSKSET